MAKRAQLARIFRHRHFQIFRMIGAGRQMFEHAAIIALTAGAMADLTPNDFADVRPVVNAVGPFEDLPRMAGRARGYVFVFWFIRCDFGYGVSSIMSVLIKRIDCKKLLRPIRQYGKADHNQDEPNDMTRHGVPVPLRFLLPRIFLLALPYVVLSSEKLSGLIHY